jgi:hypothetical protein
MDTRTGKIYMNPTDEELLQKQMTKLTQNEYDILQGLPEEERPVILALKRYEETRAENGRTNISLQEKVAFKLGFKAGKESAG